MAAQTFWKRVQRFSPILCRILARSADGRRPLTTLQICERSGLAPYEVETLSQQTDWTGVDIDTMRRFTEACRVDLTDWRRMNQIASYLGSRPSFRYLKASDRWEDFYKPLIMRWREAAVRNV